MLLRYVFLACCTLCSGELLSQRYPFINYTPIDGLVNNRVRSMFQDSKGRLYFLTSGGLSVYDGARFVNYTTADGLAQELVNDVLEITPDSILVATNVSQLNALVRGKILPLKTADGFYPVINTFFRSMDGTIYAGADDGLFAWQKDRFIPLHIAFEGREEVKFIVSIKEFGKYLLLLVNPGLGSEPGTIYLFDPVTRRTLSRHDETKTNCWDTSPQGDLWVSSSDGISILKKEELEEGVFRKHHLPGDFSSVQNRPTAYIKFDKLGQLWLGVPEGLCFVKPGQPPVVYTEANGLGRGNIIFIFQDQEGNNWFLPDGGGAQKLVNSNFQLMDRPYSGKYISDISCSNRSDSVWLYGDSATGLILIHGNEVKKFSTTYNGDYKRFVIEDGSIVYVIDGYNLLKYEVPKFGSKLKTLCHYSYSSNQLGFGILDPNRNPIFCTNFTLRVILKDCSSFLYTLHYYADQIACDKNGDLWVATRSDKLQVLSLHPENPRQYLQLKYDLSDQLKLKNPRSIVVDDSNRIWVGTRFDGLYCFKLFGKRLELLYHLTRKEGMTENFINYLAYDQGGVWATSPAGLDRIVIIENKPVVENITESNKVYISLNKVVVDREGTIWALGESGNMIKVSRPQENKQVIVPRFFIAHFNIGRQIYTPSDSVHSFKHTENNISFFVAAPSFYNEKEIKYSYVLNGSGNSQWSDPSSEAAFHFVNLAPGHYTLNLKAEFPAGKYPPQLLSYSFTVHPPWWQSWWFRVILVMLTIGIFVAIVRRYYRAKYLKQKVVLEKQQAIEKERTRIATDMHDDFGAGLSRIKYLSESIQFKKPGDESILGEVQKIASYSDEMVEKMGEIVWALNQKNDSLDHLVAFTRSYASDYLATNRIECVFHTDEILPTASVNGEVRRNVFLSVKESLHNVVKHARASMVTIQVKVDSHLKVTIHDDGVGIDWDHIRPFSNGLTNIQKRMEEIGGKAAIQNRDGTEIILDVPLKD